MELVKGDQQRPAHVLLHLRNFKRSECFVQVIKFLVENDQEGTSQETVIYSFIQRLRNIYQSGKKGCDFEVRYMSMCTVQPNLTFNYIVYIPC